MMINAHDQKTLADLKAAQFKVTEINFDYVLIEYAHLHGEVMIGEFGITYGPCCNQRDWDLTGNRGQNCSGAFNWAVKKTKELLVAEGRKIIAEFEAKASLPYEVQ